MSYVGIKLKSLKLMRYGFARQRELIFSFIDKHPEAEMKECARLIKTLPSAKRKRIKAVFERVSATI